MIAVKIILTLILVIAVKIILTLILVIAVRVMLTLMLLIAEDYPYLNTADECRIILTLMVLMFVC